MMQRAENIAVTWLRNEFGFDVHVIGVADDRRADLRVYDGESGYTIEIKDKRDLGNHSHFSQMPAGDGDPVSVRGDTHKRLNRLDNILRDGSKQIASTPGAECTFNLMWFNFDGIDADMWGRRLLYTIYGVADLRPRYSDSKGVNCVYFDYNAAYKIRNIHGVVICENCELQLAINEFATDVGAFRKTPLVKKFGNAKYDPEDFESDTSKIVLRSTIPRKNEWEILNEVKRQTGVDYHRVEMNRYTFGVGSV